MNNTHRRIDFLELDLIETPSFNQILYTKEAEMVLIDIEKINKGHLINTEA